MSAHPPTFTRQREQTAPANDGSRTIILDPTESQPESDSGDDSIGILRLRGDPHSRGPRQIQWADDVVDNEHLGRKKSKICCIYHRPRMPGDDSSSDSSSDSDTDSDNSQRGRGRKHDPSCKHHDHSHGPSGNSKRNPREVSPNAYERQPRYKNLPQPPPNAQ